LFIDKIFLVDQVNLTFCQLFPSYRSLHSCYLADLFNLLNLLLFDYLVYDLSALS